MEDNNKHNLMIYAEQVRLLYKPFLTSVIATFAGIFLFSIAQWEVVNHDLILSWVLAITIIMIMRGVLAYFYNKTKPAIAESKLWGRLFIIGSAITGVAWGTGAVLLFPENNIEHQTFVLLVIIGMCSGAVTGLSVKRSALYVYMLPAMLPLIPLFIMEDSYLSNIAILVVLITLIFYSKNANNTYFTLLENIQLRIAATEKEQYLHQKNELLKENVQLREDVERMTHHDLKSPLSIILGYSEVLRTDSNITENQLESINQIESAGRKLLDMINLNLDLYKMEKGIYEIQTVNVDLTKVFSEISNGNSHSLISKGLLVDMFINGNSVVEGEQFCVKAEKLLLHSMFFNLFKNAMEASPNDERITIKMEDGEYKNVSILNMGTVPEEIRDAFFEKYITAEKTGGSGLGTYSARLIAETLGAKISLDTSVENETKIHLKFSEDS